MAQDSNSTKDNFSIHIIQCKQCGTSIKTIARQFIREHSEHNKNKISMQNFNYPYSVKNDIIRLEMTSLPAQNTFYYISVSEKKRLPSS
jgi:hypothetical protein